MQVFGHPRRRLHARVDLGSVAQFELAGEAPVATLLADFSDQFAHATSVPERFLNC